MEKYEQFIRQEIEPLLKPGEGIEATGFLYNKSLLGMVVFGVLSFMGGGYFFAAATKQRLFLIETEMSFTALKTLNKKMIQIPFDQVKTIKIGGMLNQKTITIYLLTGEVLRFRLNTLAKFVKNQKQFIKILQNLHQQAISF